ncbi:MAG TPA: SGNH/GDSL hydrolase family protein [Ilumatobacter sp.]|nr:SGNH/GDSL hydrolase family protein [Ilumatobacter sp.]
MDVPARAKSRFGRAALLALTACLVAGTTPESATAATEVPESATRFVPVQPCRVVDTRGSDPLAGDSSFDVEISGRCGVSADASAVAATIAVIDPVAAGFATMSPAGGPRPATSTVNFGAGQVVANSQLVAVGDGAVSVYSLVTTDLIVDVTGFFVPVDRPTRAGRYLPITPNRALDTRSGEQPAANSSVRVDLGLPEGAGAAMVTVTVVAEDGPDFVTAFPAATDRPNASVVNIDRARQTRAGTTIVPLSSGGIDIYTLAGSDLVVDVAGYFTGPDAESSTDGLFVPVVPQRLVDTRKPSGASGGPRLWDGGRREFSVPGSTSDWAAIVANVVATDTEDAGFLSVGAARAAGTDTSNVGYSSAQLTVANQAVIPLAEHGFDVYALSSTHVVVDMTGWFTGERSTTVGPAPANPMPPQRNVTVIGDSALAGIEWNNAEGSLHGFKPRLELASCRRLARRSCVGRDGIRPITSVQVIHSLPQPSQEDLLVIGAGYDDWHFGFEQDFDAVVSAARARGFHHIAFTTFRSGVSYVFVGQDFPTNYAELNRIMRAKLATGDYPDVRLWDFDSYSATAPLTASGWFYADGVHQRPLGSWAAGDWLSRHIAAFDDRPCPMPWRPSDLIDLVCPDPDYLPRLIGLPDILGLYGS